MPNASRKKRRAAFSVFVVILCLCLGGHRTSTAGYVEASLSFMLHPKVSRV